jgi:hypothetical protein
VRERVSPGILHWKNTNVQTNERSGDGKSGRHPVMMATGRHKDKIARTREIVASQC